MRQYTDLLSRILKEGRLKENRTGTNTISLIGPQMEFDMDDGFPLVTERPIFIKGIIHEDLWFIDGRCNNEDLLAKGVTIWNHWALKEDWTREVYRDLPEVVQDYVTYRQGLLAEGEKYTYEDAVRDLTMADREAMDAGLPIANKPLDAKGHDELMGGHKLLRDAGVPLMRTDVMMPKGYLGPIYGKLWRGWVDHNGAIVDQLANIYGKLASDNPKLRYSRANIITSYNPGVLPDETVSAEENIKNGKQALAACHTMFQFFAEPLTQQERIDLLTKKIASGNFEVTGPTEDMDTHLDEQGIPRDQLSIKLYQRSADFPVGVPFNIAGYALILHMFCAQLNMKPAKFIHTFGDAHIYVDQVDGVKELLARVENAEAPALPTLWINPEVQSLTEYTVDDFRVDGYEPLKPQIKFAVAI